MDFMSYANLHKVRNDARTLLNSSELLRHSGQTFQTFFKHFAVAGRWAYGAEKKRTVFEDKMGWPGRDTWVNGTVSQRIEVLSMHETATWLSLGIIFVLVLILVVLTVSLQIVYPKHAMQHRVECLADVLAMVAGNDELVRMGKEMGVEGVRKSRVKTKLGWFKDGRGVVRWGVEIDDGSVEWVDGPEKRPVGEAEELAG